MTKSKLWDIRRFPQDMGRLVCFWMPAVFRLKKIHPDGTPYKERVRGGGLLIANHTSMNDPLMVGTAFWYRRVFFLAAKEVMRNPIIAMLCRGIGCIPIDRSKPDLQAIKQSLSVLKAGRLLVVFAQGSIGDQVEQIKSGAVFMALQSGTPMIPMIIGKRPHWYSRRPVIVGNTIDPSTMCTKKMPSMKDIEAITDALLNELQRCQKYEKECCSHDHI